MKLRSTYVSASLLTLVLTQSTVFAEDLNFSGTNTVRLLASDWAAYLGGSSTFDAGANDGGRLYWRGSSGDGQYIHFNLNRLSGLTMNSAASVTLQNTNATWGGSVDNSFIATANSAWTAASGAPLPGATAIADASNASGVYGSGTSISWGIGTSTFQGLVNNASTFQGLAIIGGNGSQMHFDGPINPYLEVQTNANLTNVVTVNGGSAWNGSNYSFTNGVLSISDSVAGGTSGAGNVVINSLGTVFVNGNGADNRYWAIDSTRVNTGGVLMIQGHSHVNNLTLAGGELAGIRPSGSWGSWSLSSPVTVTGATTSTISAQQVNLSSSITVDAGSTLNFTGSIREGTLIKEGSGSIILSGSNTNSGGITINSGTVVAARSAQDNGVHTLGSGAITINNGGTLRSTAQWSTSSEWNGTSVGSITINQGGTWQIDGVGQTIRNGLFLNGGSISSALLNDDWGVLHLKSGITAGGGVVSSINADTALSGNQTFTVDANSQLNYSGRIHNQIGTNHGITKAGAGTLVLSAANIYSAGTNLNQGTLRLENTSALGSGGLSMLDGTSLQLRSDSNATFNGGDGMGGLGGATINIDVNQLTSGNTNRTIQFANGGFNTYLTTINVTGGNGYALSLGGINEGFAGSLDLNAISANLSIGAIGSASAVSVLNVGGAANTTITGAINSVNGLNKSGSGTLTLNGNSSFTSTTTVSNGRLVVNGSLSSNSVVVNGSLGGSGTLANANLSGTGSINPGNSPGVLTASTVSLSGGLDFNFEFNIANGLPTWDQPTASQNDVLRLTGLTPFDGVMDSDNIVNIFLNVGNLQAGDIFTGGFYTDTNADFANVLSSATFQFFLADNQGGTTYEGNPYSLYNGPLTFNVTTVEQTADFGDGNVIGRSMQFTVVPETSVSLLGGLSALLLLRRKRQA